MKTFYLSLLSVLISTSLSVAGVAPSKEYIEQKGQLLNQIYSQYQKHYEAGLVNMTDMVNAHAELLQFKVATETNITGKIRIQKQLIQIMEEAQKNLDKSGDAPGVDILKVKLALIEARETLRQLEQ